MGKGIGPYGVVLPFERCADAEAYSPPGPVTVRQMTPEERAKYGPPNPVSVSVQIMRDRARKQREEAGKTMASTVEVMLGIPEEQDWQEVLTPEKFRELKAAGISDAKIIKTCKAQPAAFYFCLRPECYRSKQTEAQNLKAKKEREKAQKALQRAAKQGKQVVKLRSLPEGSYEQLGSQGHAEYLDRSKCEGCEKAGVAENHSGVIVEICLDPACIRKQKAAHTRAKSEETRAKNELKIERVATQAAAATAGALSPAVQELIDIARANWAELATNAKGGYWATRGEVVMDCESLMSLDAFFTYVKTWRDLCAGATSMPAQLGDTTIVIPDQGVQFHGGETSVYNPHTGESWSYRRPAIIVEHGGLILENSNGRVVDRAPDLPVYYRVRGVVYSGSKIVQQLVAIRTQERTILVFGADNVQMRKDLFVRWVKLANGLPAIEAPAPAEGESEAPAARRYRDKEGREVFVSGGLGLDVFGTFWAKPGGGLARVKSADMPMVATAEEAQANLKAWAAKKGLEEVRAE